MTCIRAMIHEHEDKHDLRAKDKEMRSPIILRVLADSIILHRFVSLQFSTHYIKDHPNHSSNSCCHLLSQILDRFVQTNKEQKNSPCMQMNDPKACNTLHPMRQFKAGHGRSSTSKRSSEICIMELRERERARDKSTWGGKIIQNLSVAMLQMLSLRSLRSLSAFWPQRPHLVALFCSRRALSPLLSPHSRREAAVDTFMQWFHGEYVQSVVLSEIMRPVYSLDA